MSQNTPNNEKIQLTERERTIYNAWLKALAARAERPYRERKDFDSLDDEDKTELVKLGLFFDRNEIKEPFVYFLLVLVDFDQKHFELSFFSKPAASAAFVRQRNLKRTEEKNLDEIVATINPGMIAIAKFCYANKIPLAKYISYKKPGASMPVFIEHLKENLYFPIVLYAFPDFRDEFANLDDGGFKEFILGETLSNFIDSLEYWTNNKQVRETLSDAFSVIQKKIG